jgi:hypothetical protein
MGGHLGHTPAGTRGTKPPPLAIDGEKHLFFASVTPHSEKAMGEDATLQVVIKFSLYIGR